MKIISHRIRTNQNHHQNQTKINHQQITKEAEGDQKNHVTFNQTMIRIIYQQIKKEAEEDRKNHLILNQFIIQMM